LVLLIGLLLVGCGPSSTSGPPMSGTSATPLESSSAPSSPQATAVASPSEKVASPVPSPSQGSPQPKGRTIITADSQFGSMLYDASGQAIYLFDAEHGARPECYGECADDWPPVLTTGMPQAKQGVRSGLLGTTRRSEGTTQVTYADHPLYFYAHEGRYQVLCHNIEEYGGTWLVVQPDGDAAPQ
jgi:predicted lipoprotein with Yx(FWY)xxD motif